VKRPTGVLICMPAFGQQNFCSTTQSLYNTCQFLTANAIPNQLRWVTSSEIAETRNLFLTFWYDGFPDCSHMLMVDADMGWPTQLIIDMLNFDKPVVGTYYARKQWPATAVGRSNGKGEDLLENVIDGHLPVEGTGAGVLLIQRETVDKMIGKFPELIDENISGHPARATLDSYGGKRMMRFFDPLWVNKKLRLSEDLAFCWRAGQCGIQVWANVNHHISHIGPFDYCIRYADWLEEKARGASAEEKQVFAA
jgi:hypothetical protein